MTEMILNLTIVPVGPRNRFLQEVGARWRFALQLAPGFDQRPSDAERDACAQAMLPWLLLHDRDEPIRLGFQTFRTGRTETVSGEVMAFPAPKLDLKVREAFKDERWKWEKYAAIADPPRSFVAGTTDQPAETSKKQILLPSVLQAFGGATPALTSGTLRCTWYFEIPVTQDLLDELPDTQDGALRIAAWPLQFTDARGPTQFDFEGGNGAFAFDGRLVRIRYRVGMNAGTHRAQTLPFECARLTATPEPALTTYWLPGIDSRLDSMAEVQNVVREALRTRARVGVLTPELLVDAKVIPAAGSSDALADARLFLDLARTHLPDPDAADADVRALVAEAVRLAKLNATPLMEQLRVAFAGNASAWWTSAVTLVNERAKEARIAKQWVVGNAPALLSALAALLFPPAPEIKPVLPNEGLDVLLGSADLRVRAEDPMADDTANDSDHAQIAELGVLVRRARTAAGLEQAAWSLATASVAVLDLDRELDSLERYWGSVIDPETGVADETLPYDKRPVIRGIESAFVNGVASTDITYRGTPLVAATVGSVLHGVEGEEKEKPVPFADVLPLSYQPVGPVRDHVHHARRCLVPPLRYGDVYQFAGFVIDRGGGLPEELTLPDRERGPMFDWDKLEPGQLAPPAGSEPIEFLRRVAVGDVNVVPAADPKKPAARPEWPALPAGVVLRAREWLSSKLDDSDAVPALLLSDGPAFTRRLPAVSFHVSAPVLDEHTLSRWMMPAAVEPGGDLAAAEAALETLNEALADIHRKRAALPKDPNWMQQQQVLPFDPAVTKIGLRRSLFDENGNVTESEELLGVQATISAFVRNPGGLPAGPQIELTPGSFAVLELVPLVAADDFTRFEPLAMRDLIEEEPWSDENGKSYIAFRATRILIEAATDALPAEDDLYDALTLVELPSGAIEVSLAAKNDAALARMAFVDRFELARQRWVWRNRPILISPQNAGQSELPPALGDAALRDIDPSVIKFDALAELDRGMVDRGRIGGRVPRAADGTPFPAARLVVDDRDGVSHADYLRFGCTLVSRYEGILAPKSQRVIALTKHADGEAKDLEPERTWRRIAAAFRGDLTLIKAPKVLAVLPLTHALEGARPAETSPDATPFLVILDEIWFREYGPGERLNVEVVLETKEIGETVDEPRPFRVGPLPDHYVAEHLTKPPFTDRRLYGTSTDPRQGEAGNRKTFPVFGPFGYSLDRSGNEALANATAFVVYPRKEIRPHYAAYVRMRRSLHAIDGTLRAESKPGGTYALYTQPDATQLVPAADARLRIAGKKYSGMPLNLQPVAEPHSAVMTQYRYLLITGPRLRDLGRGTDLFLPTHAAWVRGQGTSVDWLGKAIGNGSYTGRVLELLLNGRYEHGSAPIEKQESLRKVLEALFASKGNPEDAPAMIRRMSHSFAVDVAPPEEKS